MPTERTLEIEGTGAPATNYEFVVSGSVEGGERANLDRFDEIDGSVVTGAVGTGVDNYHVSGEITSFELDGEATVRLDGEEIDPAALGGEAAASESTSSESAATDSGSGTSLADFSTEERERAAALLEDFARFLREG